MKKFDLPFSVALIVFPAAWLHAIFFTLVGIVHLLLDMVVYPFTYPRKVREAVDSINDKIDRQRAGGL